LTTSSDGTYRINEIWANVRWSGTSRRCMIGVSRGRGQRSF